jgi:hypothetical protein
MFTVTFIFKVQNSAILKCVFYLLDEETTVKVKHEYDYE